MREDQIDNLLNAVLVGIGLVLLVVLLVKVVSQPAPAKPAAMPRQVDAARPGQAVPVVDCPAVQAGAERGTRIGAQGRAQVGAHGGVQRIADAGKAAGGVAVAAAGGATACQ